MISARAVTYQKSGTPLESVLKQTKWEIDPSKIEPNEVILKTLATPINPADVHQVSGNYASAPKRFILNGQEVSIGGNEGLFEIIHKGSSVKGYEVGNWVIPKLPSFGTWRTHALVKVDGDDPFIKIGENEGELTMNQAATVSINPCTAYQMINQNIKDWKKGDWIIQNAGNSQVSKYVTQLARLEGINTISVIRSGKSDKEIQELYDLGATKVITEEELSSDNFQETLKKWVGDSRVRLALNSIGGELVSKLIDCLSQDGYLVTYGMLSGKPITYSGGVQLFKNITTVAYWLTANTKRNPQFKVDTVHAIVELYKKRHLIDPSFTDVVLKEDDDIAEVFIKAIQSKGKHVVKYA